MIWEEYEVEWKQNGDCFICIAGKVFAWIVASGNLRF